MVNVAPAIGDIFSASAVIGVAGGFPPEDICNKLGEITF